MLSNSIFYCCFLDEMDLMHCCTCDFLWQLILLLYVSYQPCHNCKEKASMLWMHSASFTWFGYLKLCYWKDAWLWGTSCFKKCLPHLLEVQSPGCCTGMSWLLLCLLAHMTCSLFFCGVYLHLDLQLIYNCTRCKY